MRFPEFSGEWEKCTLGSIGETFNGLTGKSAVDFGSGSPYITYKSIFDSSKIDISKVEYVKITETERVKQTQNEVEYGDIFFTTSSETPEEVGMASVLLSEIRDCYLNSFCFGYRLFDKCIHQPDFFRFYLRSSNLRKKIAILAQGSTRFNISKNEVMKMPIFLPSLAEQRKISKLLSLIEDRIETQKKVIEDLKKLKDAIRVKLFREVEKHCEVYDEIRNMLDYEQPSEYLVSSTEYSDNYKTPVLTANKAFILGYTDEVHGIYDKGDCIILDDFTMDVKYVTFPFKVKSSAIKILTPKQDVDLYFIYEYLLYLGLVSEEHKRHYISEIEPMTIICPPLPKQRQVARVLRALEIQVKSAKTYQDLLSKQKQYLLNQMFI